MKFLFINSSSPDYLEDMLFAGLVERLGPEQVIPHPLNLHYYASRYHYPRDLGQCRSLLQLPADLIARRRMLLSHDFDAVIIGSTKRDTFASYLAIAPSLPKHIPLIYVDGGDWADVGGDARRMNFPGLLDQLLADRTPAIIFKREVLPGHDYPEHLHALPMAYKPQNYPQVGRKYDVTLWCVESDPIRTQALDLLEGRYDCAANGSVRNQRFKDYKRKGLGYLSELSASRIALNFRGVGWDTLRYWEIPGVESLMISQRPQIEIPDNYRHGQEVLFCKDDLSDLLDLIDYQLAHNDEREELARAAKAYTLRYHTHLARADRFLGLVAERLGKTL